MTLDIEKAFSSVNHLFLVTGLKGMVITRISSNEYKFKYKTKNLVLLTEGEKQTI